ncbi:MAG TPA: hypothetical protein VMB85_10100 [Bryobacteraceae bacterium]|nr:hypothetical protein [Bryobacteraceae bacterium]
MDRGIWNRLKSKITRRRASGVLTAVLLGATLAAGAAPSEDTLVVTSTNGSPNNIVVFKLQTAATPSLSLVNMLATGGQGGAPGASAGAVQFQGELGAVVNYGSNNVSQLVRTGDSISVARTINLASNCTKPVSAALSETQLFVAGANCAESHAWPIGIVDGSVVALGNSSAAQIVVGETWAALTMTSGALLQLPLSAAGALKGASTPVTLPGDADNTPLGAAFWGNLLAFNPAHSADSFALVNSTGAVFPVLGPEPPYPSNAPCWLAKGPGNIWYSGNSPGKAISIFFSDSEGGVFYKSVPLAGSPTDLAVSPDRHWLAVIYTAGGDGYVAVFSIDSYGDLTPVAISSPVGASSFDGVAFSQ